MEKIANLIARKVGALNSEKLDEPRFQFRFNKRAEDDDNIVVPNTIQTT